MNNTQRLQLVGASVRSGFGVQEKSANATDHQRDILGAGWPSPEDNLTKLAYLARVLATGALVEEAEAV